MKFLDEYRDPRLAQSLVAEIRRIATRPWVLMEICGGQTHTLMKYGIDELLPESVELVHGPGCPVCVTPLELIDKAIAIASIPDATLVSYGDMLRVPGSSSDLFRVKAAGGDVRIAYSPMDALAIARRHPERRVVFFAVGFETTAPANAMTVWQAKREGLKNFSVLVSHVLVPPAIRLLLGSRSNRVQGFIAPGHVCTVMGYTEYEELAAEYKVPFVVAGFEPLDLLQGILMLVRQLEEGRAEVENQYVRSVTRNGNEAARRRMLEVFEVGDRKWRGIGEIAASGYLLRPEYAAFDAERVFGVQTTTAAEPAECISAQVLQGLAKPVDCAAFGTRCTPETPLGAPMVSTEGACAAYFQFRRHA
ncbi:MAG TPA: hydrogenase formation protein HypD [Candidatus Acidoferrales bacterium]|nr:hydrogenase formation protein HypD [Candidatus Acidoferrales bacterium]